MRSHPLLALASLLSLTEASQVESSDSEEDVPCNFTILKLVLLSRSLGFRNQKVSNESQETDTALLSSTIRLEKSFSYSPSPLFLLLLLQFPFFPKLLQINRQFSVIFILVLVLLFKVDLVVLLGIDSLILVKVEMVRTIVGFE